MSDARLPSLPPEPPSSSAGKSSDSGKSGEFIGGSDREGMVDRAAFSRALTQARPPHLGGTRRTHTQYIRNTRAQKTAIEPRTASLASAEAYTGMDRRPPPRSAARAPPPHQRRRCDLGLHLGRPRSTSFSTGLRRCAEMAATRARRPSTGSARRARGTKRDVQTIIIRLITQTFLTSVDTIPPPSPPRCGSITGRSAG